MPAACDLANKSSARRALDDPLDEPAPRMIGNSDNDAPTETAACQACADRAFIDRDFNETVDLWRRNLEIVTQRLMPFDKDRSKQCVVAISERGDSAIDAILLIRRMAGAARERLRQCSDGGALFVCQQAKMLCTKAAGRVFAFLTALRVPAVAQLSRDAGVEDDNSKRARQGNEFKFQILRIEQDCGARRID